MEVAPTYKLFALLKMYKVGASNEKTKEQVFIVTQQKINRFKNAIVSFPQKDRPCDYAVIDVQSTSPS